jgi:hypothetical protein
MKILTNGCSFTYGADLDDHINERWSSYLPHDITNIAMGGQSNDLIVDNSIAWLQDNVCDYVIIQFTFKNRFAMFDKEWLSVTPSNKEFYAKMYYKYICSKEMSKRNLWKNIFLMENYLDSHNIPHFFFHIGHNTNMNDQYRGLTKWSNMMNISFLNDDKTNWHDKYSHPSAKGQKLIASKVMEGMSCL